MSKIIGIDLGTTNSVVAVLEGGEATVISTAEGGRVAPSVVAFNKNGERLVGVTAKRQATINPENTIFSVKRFMGMSFDDTTVIAEKSRVPYDIVKGKSGDVRVKIPANGRDYTPQEISAMILSKLKADAENYLGESVTQAVITVPAYFNDSQRQATKDAGRIAGLEVLRIINEPTAAALTYGLDKKVDETILVFDLGGGTFDVSVLDVSDGVIEVRATNGDTHLGGDDWDLAITDWVIDQFKAEQGIDLAQDRSALQRVREASEKAKVELSTVMETELNLPFITADASGPKHLQLALTRSKFEQLTADLVARLVSPINNAMKDAGLKANEIDEVVLVGGSTRIPSVQEKVKAIIGKEPNKSVNPDEVVALGAALQGGVLAGDVTDILLLDVTPLSLGLETMGGVMTVLIPRNTTIPTRKSEVFSTAVDNQTSVDVSVLQGERPMASDNNQLGVFRLDGLPAAPRGIPQVEVSFDIDANGIINVTAVDKASGKQQQITISASTNLSENDIDRMVQEAESNRAADEKARELIEARNMADSTVYQTEKAVSDLNGQLPPEMTVQLNEQLGELKEAINGDNVSRIKDLTAQVQQTLAQASQMAQNAAGTVPNPDMTGEEDDVIDGEFETA